MAEPRHFTRKARTRQSREERDRLIAEMTGGKSRPAPAPKEANAPVAQAPADQTETPPVTPPFVPTPEVTDPWAPVDEAAFDSDPDWDTPLDDWSDAPTTPLPKVAPPQAPEEKSDPAPEPAPLEVKAPETTREPDPEIDTAPLPEPIAEPVDEPELGVRPEPVADPVADPDPTPDPIAKPAPDLVEPSAPATAPNVIDKWAHLASIPIDAAHLEQNLIITAGRHDPAHGAFDVLRTRLVQTLLENNWKRVAITSPTRDCGKTFTAVNLAISLSRYESSRTILMDFDMRNPSVAKVLGATNPGSMGDFLQGITPVEQHLQRLGRNNLNIGANLAVALNDRVEPYAAELMQDPMATRALDQMMQDLDPDIVLYDLPPALNFDDVIAFRPQFDGVLMVVGGGSTTADEIREVMRRLGEDTPLLGVVLNQAEGEESSGYSYGY